MGAGFYKLNEGAPAASTYQFALTLPVVACVGLAHRGDYSTRFDGDILIRSNTSVLLKLDARTGRIIEFRSDNEIGDATAQLHFEPGAIGRAADHISTVAAGLPDSADANAPLSSTLAFLAEEAWSSKYLKGLPHGGLFSESTARLPALPRQFRLADIFAPLDRLVAEVRHSRTGAIVSGGLSPRLPLVP